jgi:hypothetical protein
LTGSDDIFDSFDFKWSDVDLTCCQTGEEGMWIGSWKDFEFPKIEA